MVLLLGLAKIIEDVINRESGSVDRGVLMAFRVASDPGMPVGPAWLPQSAIDITGLGSPTVIAFVTMISVVYLVVAGLRRFSLLITLMIGTSRVYLGVHWPTDVLAGWTIGAAWALGTWMIAQWLCSEPAERP
jgi:hypothetical protein